MPTRIVDIKNQRLRYLRAFKRLEHDTDTAIEVLERRIDRILRNKRPIELETAQSLIPLYNDFVKQAQNMQKGLTDFITIIAQF